MGKIKYRVWDKFKKRMVEPRLILTIHFDRRNQEPNLVTYLEKYMNPTREISDFDKVFCNEFDLMQYTGLKDMNDVEIYDGCIMTNEDNEFIGVVKIEEGNTYLSWENVIEPLSEAHDILKVIGNICENPELLEVD